MDIHHQHFPEAFGFLGVVASELNGLTKKGWAVLGVILVPLITATWILATSFTHMTETDLLLAEKITHMQRKMDSTYVQLINGTNAVTKENALLEQRLDTLEVSCARSAGRFDTLAAADLHVRQLIQEHVAVHRAQQHDHDHDK